MLFRSNRKESLTCDKDDPSPECKGAWNDFWEENYYPEEHSKHYYDYTRNDVNRPNPFPKKDVNLDKEIEEIRKAGGYEWTPEPTKKKWVLPVEPDPSGEYFVTFPDDLLDAADLKEGDVIEWVDQGDGSALLKKVTKPLGMDEC